MANATPPALVDTHCHLDVEEFAADRPAVLARARALGVTRIVVPAIRAATWPGLLQFCAGEQGVYCALGLHPVYLQEHCDAQVIALAQQVERKRPAAIGEIGLDYFLSDLDRSRQQQLFEAQLQIARAAKLPVILHVRKAHDAVLATLKRISIIGGIVHAYNGSLPQAQQYIDRGFKLGFGGMLTYERSNKLRQLAHDLPLSAIVLETDAPDLTVAQHRGTRNSPEYLPYCLAALAEVRGEEPARIAQATTANACQVLSLGTDE